jgi:hypothetical protein
MVDILDRYGLPLFTGYTPHRNCVRPEIPVTPTDTSLLDMEMSITDYYTENDGLTARNDRQWSELERYVTSLGFRVKRDHDGRQSGLECGIIAAEVIVYLKQRGDFFMEAVDRRETFYASAKYPGGSVILEAGNRSLDAAGLFSEAKKCDLQRQGKEWTHATEFLSHDRVVTVIDSFNEGPSLLKKLNKHGVQEPSCFVTLPSYDEFLNKLAKNVHEVSLEDEGAYRRVYSVTNTEDGRRIGTHWVAIVYSIRKKKQAVMGAEQQAQTLDLQEQPTDKRAIEVLPLEGASGEERLAENEARLIRRREASTGDLGWQSGEVRTDTWESRSPIQKRHFRRQRCQGVGGRVGGTAGARVVRRPSPLANTSSNMSINCDRDMRSTPTVEVYYDVAVPLKERGDGVSLAWGTDRGVASNDFRAIGAVKTVTGWIGIYGGTTAECHYSMRPEPNDLGTSVIGQVGP